MLGLKPRSPGRAAVAARIPGEDVEVRQVELVGEVRHAAGMLVAAVEQQDGAFAGSVTAGQWR